ncbi:uncharacterized protein LOC143326457 [Chaetodon auriga]|uniref:uncharacterized protein LOC143326457 n=1 Tax=Chaetodon auriga TaxID=39042 RepID=UPI004032A0A0
MQAQDVWDFPCYVHNDGAGEGQGERPPHADVPHNGVPDDKGCASVRSIFRGASRLSHPATNTRTLGVIPRLVGESEECQHTASLTSWLHWDEDEEQDGGGKRPPVGHPPDAGHPLAGGQLAVSGGKTVVSVNRGMMSVAAETGAVAWCWSRSAGFSLTDKAAYLLESGRLEREGDPPWVLIGALPPSDDHFGPGGRLTWSGADGSMTGGGRFPVCPNTEVMFFGADSPVCEDSNQLVTTGRRDLRVVSRESFLCSSSNIRFLSSRTSAIFLYAFFSSCSTSPGELAVPSVGMAARRKMRLYARKVLLTGLTLKTFEVPKTWAEKLRQAKNPTLKNKLKG